MDLETEKKLREVTEWLTKEYSGIRTGQASVALLDNVSVESYGARVPVQQVGSISIEDARTLRIAPWDTGQIVALEKAIQEADLGVSIATDSAGVRVIFPELTSERRVQLTKLAKSKLEDARVSVKAIRDDLMKDIDKQFKNGDLGEDERFSLRDGVQEMVENTNNKLEALFVSKEKELEK
ncbi:MAG: ribosome recycling factor [Candidatus Paceibacterota bacterium]